MANNELNLCQLWQTRTLATFPVDRTYTHGMKTASGKADIAVHAHAGRAEGVPPAVFTAFVEKVVVSGTKKDVQLIYVLRDGSEYRIDGVR